jgi:hypothetical protein
MLLHSEQTFLENASLMTATDAPCLKAFWRSIGTTTSPHPERILRAAAELFRRLSRRRDA